MSIRPIMADATGSIEPEHEHSPTPSSADKMQRFSHVFLRGGGSRAAQAGAGLRPFLSLKDVRSLLRTKPIVWFGEYHSEERICTLLEDVVKQMLHPAAQMSGADVPKHDGACPAHQPQRNMKKDKVVIIMEHFSYDMDPLLNEYMTIAEPLLSFEEFTRKYKEDYGTEGHDLVPYRGFLELCRANSDKVELRGGFVPRAKAAAYTKLQTAQKKAAFLDQLSAEGYIPPKEMLDSVDRSTSGNTEVRADDFRQYLTVSAAETSAENEEPPPSKKQNPEVLGHEDHDRAILYGSVSYLRLFESLMSGRDLYDTADPADTSAAFVQKVLASATSSAAFCSMFGAQLIKDWSMAYKVWLAYEEQQKDKDEGTKGSTKILVVAGKAHMHHYTGAPECFEVLRRFSAARSDPEQCMILTDMMYEHDLDEKEEKTNLALIQERVLESAKAKMLLEGDSTEAESPSSKKFSHPYADILFVYDEDDEHELEMPLEEAMQRNKVLSNGNGSCPYRGAGEGNSELQNTASGCGPVHLNKHNLDPPSCTSSAEAVKKETQEAYDAVGSTAFKKGNAEKARLWLSALGYTEEEQRFGIGEENIFNFQGVGNPFTHAKISQGERVLDLGCGLGVDTFLAAYQVGEKGAVVALDFAKKEIAHAQQKFERLREREAAQMETEEVSTRKRADVGFIHGDIEQLPFSSTTTNQPASPSTKELTPESFDVVISNGAFCLVPDKEKAFLNVFRALKPGGRMSICTTTIRGRSTRSNSATTRVENPSATNMNSSGDASSLPPEHEWPVCMRMFAKMDSLQPILEKTGFHNVSVIEQSVNEELFAEFEEKLDVDEQESGGTSTTTTSSTQQGQHQGGRFKIHGNYVDRPEYRFLENLDVDAFCATVVIYGEKPLARGS
ncbi:unnamed protein product [Amoebophrya sp. A25]|nr:unnamed protein product [Amoebophrya sp. A25]|eukprot:GSA25T00017252001.1